MRLDHIGIAVRDLKAALTPYQQALGLEPERVEEVPTESVQTAFFRLGDTLLELLEPLDGSGPIAGFLEKRGEGIHHLAVEVPDIEAAMARARVAGIRLLSEEPRPGAGGSRVCFLHPKDLGGVLLELVEQPRRGKE
ncbi:MAG: methylmalonyl-CoA epimerase [Firmicutes bacterium]|nr:methylmalonyl-CoA epimerase [Bacillota bacterium]